MKKLSFIVVGLFLVVSCFGSGDAPDHAEKWASKHYASKYSSTECGASDSDDDGYVSCTVFFKDDTRDPLAIECATGHGVLKCDKPKGCRVATGKIGRRK